MIKVLKNGFIEVDIPEEMVDKAKRSTINVINSKNTLIKDDTSSVIGTLGELMFKLVFPNAIQANTFNYDFIWNQKTIDIKTKTTSSNVPKETYENSIFAYQSRFICDEYVFINVSRDYKKGWILGKIDKKDYLSKAKLYKKGDVDKNNGFVFKADKYNLAISELEKIGKLYKASEVVEQTNVRTVV